MLRDGSFLHQPKRFYTEECLGRVQDVLHHLDALDVVVLRPYAEVWHRTASIRWVRLRVIGRPRTSLARWIAHPVHWCEH